LSGYGLDFSGNFKVMDQRIKDMRVS